MRKRRPNYRLVKIHRSYTVEEVASLFGTHKNTVRAWVKAGLPTSDSRRPALILGRELAAYLQARRAVNKRPCTPGQIYCVRCRTPKGPAGNSAEYQPITATLGNLVGICPDCDSMIYRRTSRAKVAAMQVAVAFFTWWDLKNCVLIPLKQSPLRWGFSWIKGFSWKRLWTSMQSFSSENQLEFVMRNVEAARRHPMSSGVGNAFAKLTSVLSDRTTRAKSTIGRWPSDVAASTAELYRQLAIEADARLTRNLIPQWKEDLGPLSGCEPERGYHDLHLPDNLSGAQRATQLQRIADEEFVALVYLSYIRAVLVQIRTRVGTSAVLYVLLLWTLTCYPWMNHHAILLEMSAMLTAIAIVAISIFAQMQRDEILTVPGKLDGEFFIKVLSVVGIPTLTLVASQFPEFSNAIYSWLVPGLSNVH